MGRRFPDTGFARKSYTNRIFGYIGNKLIKVLFGQRGAGKSYLLRQIMVHLLDEGVSARNVLYISRSFTDSGFISGREGLEELLSVYRERLHPVGKIYIFIEEIQNIDGWEEFVRAHSQDWVNSCELFISGSNRRMIPCDTEGIPDRHYVSLRSFLSVMPNISKRSRKKFRIRVMLHIWNREVCPVFQLSVGRVKVELCFLSQRYRVVS